jgi:hypothetical protein
MRFFVICKDPLDEYPAIFASNGFFPSLKEATQYAATCNAELEPRVVAAVGNFYPTRETEGDSNDEL